MVTSVNGHDVVVTVDSLPAAYLRARGLLTPLHVAREFGRTHTGPVITGPTSGEQVTDLFGYLAGTLLVLGQRSELFTDSEYGASINGGVGRLAQNLYYSLIRDESQDPWLAVVNEALDLSVMVEESPAQPEPIRNLLAMTREAKASGLFGSEVAVSLAVAHGMFPPLALLSIPAGVIVLGIAVAVTKKVENTLNPVQERIAIYRTMLERGDITQGLYDKAVAKIVAQDVKPQQRATDEPPAAPPSTVAAPI